MSDGEMEEWKLLEVQVIGTKKRITRLNKKFYKNWEIV